MCAMGINGFSGSSYYGNRIGRNYDPRRLTPLQYQQAENKRNATKAALTIGGVIAAVVFRKPLGKLLAPLANTFKTKFPTLSNTASAVKGRAGRILGPIKEKVSGIFHKIKPAVKKAGEEAGTFVRETAAPKVKQAAQDTVTFTKEKVAPQVVQKTKSFLEKVAQKANSDLPKLMGG